MRYSFLNLSLLALIFAPNSASALGIVQQGFVHVQGGTITLQRGGGNVGTLTLKVDFGNANNFGNAAVNIRTQILIGNMSIGQPPNPVTITFTRNNTAGGRFDPIITANDGEVLGNSVSAIFQRYGINPQMAQMQGSFGNVLDNGSVLQPDPVPGPLPILGALQAFAFSRKLRQKLRNYEKNIHRKGTF